MNIRSGLNISYSLKKRTGDHMKHGKSRHGSWVLNIMASHCPNFEIITACSIHETWCRKNITNCEHKHSHRCMCRVTSYIWIQAVCVVHTERNSKFCHNSLDDNMKDGGEKWDYRLQKTVKQLIAWHNLIHECEQGDVLICYEYRIEQMYNCLCCHRGLWIDEDYTRTW